MGSNFYRPPDDDRVDAKTDILDDLPQRHAKEDLIPKIAKYSRNASNVTPLYFEYFQRMKTGRRCSCFTVEADPQGICKLCFGTGIVGGYNKRGTKLEVLDVTRGDLRCMNVGPDYTNPTRPVYFSLIKGAVYGSLEWEFPITSNVGKVDLLQTLDFQPTGSNIYYYVKSPSEADYVLLDKKAIELRLGQKQLQFKVTFRRDSPNAALPKLVGIRFVYMLRLDTEIRVDIPRVAESLTLEEFGIYESFQSQTMWLDSTLKNCSTEDFMVNTLDSTRWKTIEVKDNKPLGINTSWDLVCRLIQRFEPYAQVPLGEYDKAIPPGYVKSIQTDQLLRNDPQYTKGNPAATRRPGDQVEETQPDGPSATPPGTTKVGKPLREV